MRTKYAAVGVHFIDDNEAQGFEEILPGGVVGEDPRVQHVGVGEDDG